MCDVCLWVCHSQNVPCFHVLDRYRLFSYICFKIVRYVMRPNEKKTNSWTSLMKNTHSNEGDAAMASVKYKNYNNNINKNYRNMGCLSALAPHITDKWREMHITRPENNAQWMKYMCWLRVYFCCCFFLLFSISLSLFVVFLFFSWLALVIRDVKCDVFFCIRSLISMNFDGLLCVRSIV